MQHDKGNYRSVDDGGSVSWGYVYNSVVVPNRSEYYSGKIAVNHFKQKYLGEYSITFHDPMQPTTINLSALRGVLLPMPYGFGVDGYGDFLPYQASISLPSWGMIESSIAAQTINGGATLVDASTIASELFPPRMLPCRSFDNVKVSAAASKVIARGNTLLTWTAVAADGIDLYNNRAMATNADYAKFGTDVGLAAAGTVLLGVATFVPGVNVVAWGIALFAVSTANTYGAFDPLYLQLNK